MSCALLVGAVFILLAKSNPIKAYGVMFTGPFSSKFGISETLVRAVPLLLVGLGIVISFRSGILNIGAEGQILIGAITASAAATFFPQLAGGLLAASGSAGRLCRWCFLGRHSRLAKGSIVG